MKQGNLFRGYLLNCRLSLMGGIDASVLLFIWSYATEFYEIRVGDNKQRAIWAYPNQTTIASYLGVSQGAISKALVNLEKVNEIEKVRYLEYKNGVGEILRGEANPTVKQRPVRRDTRYLIWNCVPWAARDPGHQGQWYHKMRLYELREQGLIRDMGEACLTLLALCVDLQPGGSIAVGDRPTDAGKNLYERLTYRTGQTVSAVKRHLTRLTRLGLIYHVGTQSRGRAGRFLEATYELNVNYISIFKDDRRSPSGNKSDDRVSEQLAKAPSKPTQTPIGSASDEVIISGRIRKAATFDQLTFKERRTLELRYGLEDGKRRTQRETANELRVCAQRARELEVHALDKLYGDRLSLEERRNRFAEDYSCRDNRSSPKNKNDDHGPSGNKSESAGPPEQKPAAPATTEQGDAGLIIRSTFKTYGTPALICHFVICGYTWSQWSQLNPRTLRTLVIGLPVDGNFQCCGLVGGGLSARGRRGELYALLKGTEIEKSPFPDEEEILFTREHPQWCRKSYPQRGIAWVEPILVAQVKFAQFTRRCRLTMPMYRGLRRDLRPEDLREVLEKLKAIGGGG